ncbi:hypothetical protein [[Phormidium] sp. ETS-05]|uniref:hypothetical protein n=1 Tax=[Phormidium] sp. ETS-05 TaxID=222819 RepID=UPI0018EEF577|nr:hypothetical protein [[Phormidium] sp. ETS-05]
MTNSRPTDRPQWRKAKIVKTTSNTSYSYSEIRVRLEKKLLSFSGGLVGANGGSPLLFHVRGKLRQLQVVSVAICLISRHHRAYGLTIL